MQKKHNPNNGEQASYEETNQADDYDYGYDPLIDEIAAEAVINAYNASSREEQVWEDAVRATRRERSAYKAYMKALARKDSKGDCFSLGFAAREAAWRAAHKVLHAAKMAWKAAYAEYENAAGEADEAKAEADFMEECVKRSREQLARKNKAGAP